MKRLFAVMLAALSIGSLATAAAVNKTVVISGASARVDTLCFSRDAVDVMNAKVCASASKQDGGIGEQSCEDFVVPNGALKTSASNLMDNQALVLWRTHKNLEK